MDLPAKKKKEAVPYFFMAGLTDQLALALLLGRFCLWGLQEELGLLALACHHSSWVEAEL